MGNNLFQYFAAKFYNYNNKEKVKIINLPSFQSPKPKLVNRIINNLTIKLFNNVTDKDFYDDDVNLRFLNVFTGYGELPQIFQGKKSTIKKHFEQKIFFNTKPFKLSAKTHNVVLHLRLGDRFLRKTDYEPGMQYDLESLQNIINTLKVKHRETSFFIVTDFKSLKEDLTFDKFQDLNFHVKVPESDRIEYHKANTYLISLQRFIEREDCQILYDTTLSEDFSYMYFADTLIFRHGTLAWWAGFLGNQSQVFVSENWRPVKALDNKKLSSNIKDDRWCFW